MLDGPGIPYTTFPTIEIGPLTLRTFGLFVALGIAAGIAIASRRNERFGIPARQTERIGLLLVVVGLVGRVREVVADRVERRAAGQEQIRGLIRRDFAIDAGPGHGPHEGSDLAAGRARKAVHGAPPSRESATGRATARHSAAGGDAAACGS